MNESGYFSTASGSFHTTSRPPSRAWSESTERPGSSHSTLGGGSRTLTQEIEHIKKLITRAESNRQSSAGSITAVVFRTRKQEPVGREHIFHELDALKRRIKHEQQLAAERAKEHAHVLERRASQIDPGQESESEAESVLDERDEELERANEALQVQRDRFESLLENAEERVDLLTGQKEGLALEKQRLEELLASEKSRLEVQLNDERQRSQIEKHSLEAEIQREKLSRESVLCSAEERLDRLTEEKEIAKARTNHLIEERDLLKRELEKLAAETGKLEADVVREKERLKGELGDTKVQLTRATKEKTSLENELQATRTWVEELNAKIEDGANALQEKSKAFDDLRTEKRSTDVAHRSTQEEILRLHALKSEVEIALKNTSAKVAKLEQENRDAAEYLQNVLASNAASEKALRHQLQESRGRCDSLVAKAQAHERASHDLQQRLAAVEMSHEAATKRAVELGRTHDEVVSKLKSNHAGELDYVRAEEASKLKDLEVQHLYEKAELQSAHVDEIQQVREEEVEKTAEVKRQQEADVKQLDNSHQAQLGSLERQHAEALEALKAAHANKLGQVKSDAAAELDAIKQELTAERTGHAKELDKTTAAGKDQLAARTAELDHAKSQLVDLSSERDALREQVTSSNQSALHADEQIAGLRTTHAREVERLGSAVHDVEAKLKESRDDLEKHRAASQVKEAALASELSSKSAQVSHYEMKLAELRLATDTSAAELEKKVAELSQNFVSSTESLRDAERSHATALAKLSSDHGAQLEEMERKHAEEVVQARSTSIKQHEQAIQDLKQQHEKSLRDAIEAHQEQQNELQAVHAAVLDRLGSDAQVVDEKRVHELERRHTEALQRGKQESDRVDAVLKANHSEELERRDREHQAAVDETVRSLKASHQFLLDQRSRNAALNLEQARSDHVAEVSSLQVQLHEVLVGHEQTIAKTRQEYEAEMRRVALAHEGESQASRIAGEQKVAAVIQSYESRLATLQQDNEDALRDLQDAHAQTSQAAEQRFQILQKSHHDAIEDAKARSITLEQDRDTLLQQHESHISNLQATHEAALGAIQGRYVEKTAELERSYATRAEAEQEKQRLVASDLVSAHALQLKALREEHAVEGAALNSKLEQARQDALKSHAEHDSVVAELRKEHTSYTEQVSDEHKAELDRAQERALQASSEFAAATSRHAEEVTQLRAEHETALEEERSARAAAIEFASKQHDEELARVRRTANDVECDMARLASDHGKTISKLRAEQETAIEKSTLEHARVHEKLAAEHDQEIRRLQTTHNADMAKVRKEMENSTADSAAAAVAYDTQIANMRTEHAEQIGAVEAEIGKALRKDHEAALELLRGEHEEQIARLQESGNMPDHDRELEHQAEIVNVRGLGKADLEKLRGEHSIAMAAAEFAQKESVYQMQSGHDQQLKILAEQHQKRLEDLRVTMTQRQAKREEDFEAGKKVASDELDSLRREHTTALDVARSEGGSKLEAKLAEAAAKVEEEIAMLKIEHDKSLSEARLEIDNLQRGHEDELASVKLSLEGELDAARKLHRTSVEELQTTLRSQLEEAQSHHSKAILDHDNTWLTKMKALTDEHAESLTALSASSAATTASKMRDLERDHTIAVAKAIEEAKQEAEKKAAAAERQHRSAVEKAQSSSQAEVRNLKKRHQDAMAHVRDAAQKSAASQMKQLDEIHRKALGEERARAAETLKMKSAEVETAHKAQLVNLEARLKVENETQIASRKAASDAEIEALQVRLDAAMTGQAEAERSLASLRQKNGTAERRIADAKAESEEQITALVKEKDDLTSQLEQVQTSLRKLQRKHSSGSAMPRAASIAMREDVAELQTQILTLEGERSSLKQLLQKRQEEKDEVSRQNDFLVKELEMLLQQRAKSRENARSSTDALVQTDSFPAEPKADMDTFTPIKAARRNTNASRPMTPLSPGVRQARDDIENAWKARSFEDYLDNARAELSELGSVISANEALFARKITEHVGELQRAKDELAAEYSAKVEALARDKDTMEMLITSEQHAKFVKDRKKLVAKYGADFEDVTGRSAVLTGLPGDTAVALRSAEQRLVNDYNQRITKRKSQIALKHAEEFQTITQDYDRQVSVLLNSRSRLEGDLSVDPSKFEDEYGDISKRSARLVAERKSNIGAPRSARKSRSPHAPAQRDRAARDQEVPQMPIPPATSVTPATSLEIDRTRARTRQWTSNPRDEQSIPRSSSRPREFFPGSRDSPEATSQPMRERRGSNKHPPVPQHFLMRTKEAADFFSPARVSSGPSPEPVLPRTPRGRPRSTAGPAEDDYALRFAPASVQAEQQAAFADQRVVSLQEKSPNILRRIKDKVSLNGGSRPSSSSGRPSSSAGLGAQSKAPFSSWRPSHRKRSKSRHLSSGTIYDPAKYPMPPAPAPYDV